MAILGKFFSYGFLVHIAILGLFITSINACSKTEKQDTQVDAIDFDKLMSIIGKPVQEYSAMLSIKYQTSSDQMERFLDSYLSNTNMGYMVTKNSLNKDKKSEQIDYSKYYGLSSTDYHNALVYASQATGIPLATAAQIIIEYNLLSNSKECENITEAQYNER